MSECKKLPDAWCKSCGSAVRVEVASYDQDAITVAPCSHCIRKWTTDGIRTGHQKAIAELWRDEK